MRGCENKLKTTYRHAINCLCTLTVSQVLMPIDKFKQVNLKAQISQYKQPYFLKLVHNYAIST